MLNYLWGGMIIIGIIVAVITGRLPEVTEAIINSPKEAVQLCITVLGVMSMWMGVMKIAEKSGLIASLSRRMRPMLRFLFPDVPDRHPAQKYISINIIANVLGLGWAATPAGIKAMEELQTLNPEKDTASRAMCMFMIVNMSSLQLVTINILVYRAQYGSANPAEIIGPSIFATAISTIAAIIAGKLLERGYGK